jgi:hypothetical protein
MPAVAVTVGFAIIRSRHSHLISEKLGSGLVERSGTIFQTLASEQQRLFDK